jgi:hypothetical protein
MFKRVVLALAVAALPFQANALETKDLLALVAMPLAVAAVSEVTDIPMNDLIDVVTLLNDAEVPPVQFVEVVRYVPVALVSDTEPRFEDVLREQIALGFRGSALVPVIEEQFVAYGLPVIDLNTTRVVTVVDEPFIPPVVTTRVTEIRTHPHPHGGPPGQLKKVAGVQTGAEIVHGRKPGHDKGRDRVHVTRVVEQPRVVVAKPKVAKLQVVKPQVVKPQVVKPQKEHGGDQGNRGGGHEDHGDKGGGGGGKGHGKGKG